MTKQEQKNLNLNTLPGLINEQASRAEVWRLQAARVQHLHKWETLYFEALKAHKDLLRMSNKLGSFEMAEGFLIEILPAMSLTWDGKCEEQVFASLNLFKTYGGELPEDLEKKAFHCAGKIDRFALYDKRNPRNKKNLAA